MIIGKDIMNIRKISGDNSITSAQQSNERKLYDDVRNNNWQDINKLLEDGVDPTIIEKEFEGRKTLLILAASEGHLDVIQTLINKYKIDPNQTNIYDKHPLVDACYDGHLEVVKFLIDNGANIHYGQEIDGCNKFLVYAIRGGYLDVAMELIERGAKYDKDSLLRIAIQYKPSSKKHPEHILEAVHFLINQNANLYQIDSEGKNLVTEAIQARSLEILKILDQRCPDLFKGSNYSSSPLIDAIGKHDYEIVKFLVEKGFDVNQQSKSKSRTTPLYLAARFGHLNIVKLLVANGADSRIKSYCALNERDLTPRQIAQFWNTKNHQEVVDFLKGVEEAQKNNSLSTNVKKEAQKNTFLSTNVKNEAPKNTFLSTNGKEEAQKNTSPSTNGKEETQKNTSLSTNGKEETQKNTSPSTLDNDNKEIDDRMKKVWATVQQNDQKNQLFEKIWEKESNAVVAQKQKTDQTDTSSSNGEISTSMEIEPNIPLDENNTTIEMMVEENIQKSLSIVTTKHELTETVDPLKSNLLDGRKTTSLKERLAHFKFNEPRSSNTFFQPTGSLKVTFEKAPLPIQVQIQNNLKEIPQATNININKVKIDAKF